MAIRKRIEGLEGNSGKGAGKMPSVIFLCDGGTGEPMSALVIGRGNISREFNEAREAFEARATAGATAAISLPDNGCAALASGQEPIMRTRATSTQLRLECPLTTSP